MHKHIINKTGKKAELSQLGGICVKLNLLRLEFPCPDFLADFLQSLIRILSLYKMSFKIDSHSMVPPHTVCFGARRQRSDRRSYES